MLIQPFSQLVDALRSDCDPSRVRMTTKLLKQISATGQAIQQMVRGNTPPGTMSDVTLNRKHDARPVDAFGDLRRCDTNHTSMPTLTCDNSNMGTRLSVVRQLRNSQIDDLLLNDLTLLIASIQMYCQSARFFRVTSVKQLNDCLRRIHASSGIDSGSQAKTQIVCCHALAISATSHLHQCAQTRISRFC